MSTAAARPPIRTVLEMPLKPPVNQQRDTVRLDVMYLLPFDISAYYNMHKGIDIKAGCYDTECSNQYGFSKAIRLNKGDYIRISTETDYPPLEPKLFVAQYRKRRAANIPPQMLEPISFRHIAYLLGTHLGNGYASHKHPSEITFSKARSYSADKVMRDIKFHLGYKAVITDIGHGSLKLSYGSGVFGSILVQHFGTGAHNKRIPDWMFTQPKKLILNFIDGYIDTDGSRSDTYTKLYSCNGLMLQQLQRLLMTRFSIVTSLTLEERSGTIFIKGRRTQLSDKYTLWINTKDIQAAHRGRLAPVGRRRFARYKDCIYLPVKSVSK